MDTTIAAEARTFQARMDSLPAAVDFVAAFCTRHGIADGDALRLTLMVEELFTNTVAHGHGGDCDAPVHVELGVAETHLALHYQDSAPPFDPRRHADAAAPALDAEVDARGVGGLGVHLVAKLAQSLDYDFVDGANRLRLRLRREG